MYGGREVRAKYVFFGRRTSCNPVPPLRGKQIVCRAADRLSCSRSVVVIKIDEQRVVRLLGFS